jgi:hypothetical protein
MAAIITNSLDFLDAKHRLWTRWVETWRMNERRAFGRYQTDLMRFGGEKDERYAQRQDRATYVNFMRSHAQAVTGQLRVQGAPTPENGRFSFGALGEVHPRSALPESDETYGDLVYYNIDGVGGDGSEYPVFMDSVDERAQHAGHRILMVEVPPLNAIGRNAPTQGEAPEITANDVLAGRRPYAIEFPAGAMTMWATTYGRRDFAILRVPVDSGKVVDGKWVEPPAVDASGNGLGYYLLVRAGCTLLGSTYDKGGYWLFSPDKKLIRTSQWSPRLNGEIPLWYHYGLKDPGTEAEPSESASTTEGLGRVGVSLMDTMSARDWDAFDAAGSRKWLLNGSMATAEETKEQWDAKSMLITVQPAFDPRTGDTNPVTLYDDSAGAVAPAVFQAIIDAKFVEAREQSFQTLTSMPGSSGWSKEAGWLEVKAPYLARRASYRQQSDQNMVRFMNLRFGRPASGFAQWQREYTLTPVVEEIEASIDLMQRASLRSPTLEPELVIGAVKRRLGGLPQPPAAEGQEPEAPEQYEARVRQELGDAAREAQTSMQQANALTSAFGG